LIKPAPRREPLRPFLRIDFIHTTIGRAIPGGTMTRRVLILLTALATLVGVLSIQASANTHFPSSVFTANLSGENEVPAVDSDGSGFSSVTVSEDGTELQFRLYVNDLADVTMAHIHVGSPGENGPVAAFLFGPEDPGVAADGLIAEGTITEADLIPTDGVFDGTMAELIELMEDGETYVNVHTETNPDGEIRGQLVLAPFNFGAQLSGSNEVPPVATDGTGFAAFSSNAGQTALDFTLLTYGLEDVIQAHIHIGAPDENGPVAVFLFGPADPPVTFDGILAQGTITEADLIATPGVFDGTMATLMDHLRAGTAYANVHTVANAGGEIRGTVEGLERGIPGARFTDDDSSVHEANIEIMAAAEITVGCNPPNSDRFCPTDELTRGQAAAFFKRALNLGPGSEDFFTDDENSIFEGDINAIAEVGITRGCNPPDNDRFCPDDTTTRAPWASFMVRALALTAGGGDDLFIDDDDSIHETDIDRLATARITLGCNPPVNDRYCPDGTVTREQTASFFVRAMGWRAFGP
jgi:hypothetical protein